MLANRADTYNLGEIIGDTADVFEMSYLENSLTSNPVLDRLASRSQKDVYAVMKMAQGETGEAVDLEGNYSVAEVDEMVAVMKKLMRRPRRGTQGKQRVYPLGRHDRRLPHRTGFQAARFLSKHEPHRLRRWWRS